MLSTITDKPWKIVALTAVVLLFILPRVLKAI